jgi:putative ABC transport system permease protein
MYRFGWNSEMSREGGNPWDAGSAPLVEYRWTAGEYFKTMGIRLLKGRLFTDQDRASSPRVIVISKAMADKFWPGENPLGRRISGSSPYNSQNAWEVIGVVNDVRSYGLGAITPYEMYRSLDQQPFGAMTVVMKTTGEDPGPAVQAARQVVATIDPTLPLTTVQTMEQVVGASVGQPRLLSALTVLFGGLAGLLAIVGVYGVTAYNVRRQRREFGIRLALGADARSVHKLVVGRGILVAMIGVATGAVAALLLTGTLKAMLNDVKPLDPTVFALDAALVLVASGLACYLPARAAARTDPMVVLRDS